MYDNSKSSQGSGTEYDSDYQIGQSNVQMMGMDVHNPVFAISAVAILLFIVFALIFPADAKEMLVGARTWSIQTFDWLFMIGGNVFVLFCLALIVLPVGKVKLGGKSAKLISAPFPGCACYLLPAWALA